MHYRYLIMDFWGQLTDIDGTNDEELAKELSKACNLVVIDTSTSEILGRRMVVHPTNKLDYGM